MVFKKILNTFYFVSFVCESVHDDRIKITGQK